RDHRGLDGDLTAEDDRRRTRLFPRAEALSGGRRRGDFLVSRGMGVAQGKKVSTDGVAAQTIEAQPVFGQIKPTRRGASERRTQT
ncbi:hypothetical protein, partial [Bradyrhizobium sp. UFLA05-112]